MTINNHSGVQLRIRGKVQGVGFRPYVWQLAQRLQLHGDVCNDGDGVVVRLQEDPAEFIAQLAWQDYQAGRAIPAEQAQPIYLRNKIAQTTQERQALKAN